jgi:UTP--glucose-1-phosphate uridylyltransferase
MSGVKGVILVAGYGSRFLPVTKVVPKELLPIVDRPALDFVVQEFVDAGITEVLLISSRRKRAVEDWFDHDAELEGVFEREGARAKLDRAQPPDVNVTVVRQRAMRGTGQALLLARNFAGDDPIVVAFPDDLFGQPNCTAQLIARHEATGCSVLSCADLTGQDVSRYGVIDADAELRVRGIVEKPAPGTEPSHLISLGRYLYTPELFEALASGWACHRGTGEFYPMEAMNKLAAQGRLVAEVVDAPRYDTGAPLGYLQAVVALAEQHPEVGADFTAWLRARYGA